MNDMEFDRAFPIDQIQKHVSVGSVTKKIIAINPNLTAHQVIQIIRSATRTRGALAGDFASAEHVDETQALELARATLS